MSYFEQAILFTMSAEDSNWRNKGKLEDLEDGASWTFLGITQRDDAKYLPPDIKGIPALAELYKTDKQRAINIVLDIYHKEYYNSLLDGLKSYKTAARIFDQCVNAGQVTSYRMAQASVNKIKPKTFSVDTKGRTNGIINQTLIDIINDIEEELYYKALVNTIEIRYRSLKNFPRFGEDWLRRLHWDNSTEMD